MAKVNSSFFTFKGKLGGLVFVNNSIHGAYVRMPRGTYKAATLNDTLQKNADKAKKVTSISQPVYKALSAACGSFRQKNLWQMILKRMYTAASTEESKLVKSLEGLEMNEAYTYSRIVPAQTVETRLERKTLKIVLGQQSHAVFPSSTEADGYCYRLQIVYLGDDCRWLTTTEDTSRWISYEEKRIPYLPFSFVLPQDAVYYLILIEVRGGKGGKAIETRKATGIQIVLAGNSGE